MTKLHAVAAQRSSHRALSLLTTNASQAAYGAHWAFHKYSMPADGSGRPFRLNDAAKQPVNRRKSLAIVGKCAIGLLNWLRPEASPSATLVSNAFAAKEKCYAPPRVLFGRVSGFTFQSAYSDRC
jgi:hypothetical protein